MVVRLRSNDDEYQNLQISARLRDEECEIAVRNPLLDLLRPRYDTLGQTLEGVFNVGVAALSAVSTGVDGNALRAVYDSHAEKTLGAVDQMNTALAQLTSEDGPLVQASVRAARTAGDELSSLLKGTMSEAIDPSKDGSFMASVKGAWKEYSGAINEILEVQSRRMDQIARGMRDLDPDSEMGRSMKALREGLQQVQQTLAIMQATAEERRRGTTQGLDYQDSVCQVVSDIGTVYGDFIERTADQPGLAVEGKGRSKAGDCVSWVSEDVGVVFEAKNRKGSPPSAKAMKAELDLAMRNRNAQSAVAVLSNFDVRFMSGQPFQILDKDRSMFAVVYDETDRDPCFLKIAYRLAREAAMASAVHEGSVDVERIRDLALSIASRLAPLSEFQQKHTNIRKLSDEALAVANKVRDEVMDVVSTMLATLDDPGEREGSPAA